jgi:hypothetical protein
MSRLSSQSSACGGQAISMRVIATALAQRAVSLLHQAQPKPQPLTSSIFGSMVSSSAIPGRGSAAAASTSSSSSCAGVHHQMLCAHDGGARPTAEHGAHDGSPRQSGRSPAPVRPGRPRLQPPAPPAPGPPAQACTTRCYARTTAQSTASTTAHLDHCQHRCAWTATAHLGSQHGRDRLLQHIRCGQLGCLQCGESEGGDSQCGASEGGGSQCSERAGSAPSSAAICSPGQLVRSPAAPAAPARPHLTSRR